ncbi:hypothetical protein [Burkholderia ubonensis]|uniref:hypothetical protein n=1 Tax=Burkholderia ubonensis TaxID=101571 RepID=UPI0012FC4795|nr:hypothetical protein [Burkholderia ubonensis]
MIHQRKPMIFRKIVSIHIRDCGRPRSATWRSPDARIRTSHRYPTSVIVSLENSADIRENHAGKPADGRQALLDWTIVTSGPTGGRISHAPSLFVLMFESGFMCELELFQNVMPRVGVARGAKLMQKAFASICSSSSQPCASIFHRTCR